SGGERDGRLRLVGCWRAKEALDARQQRSAGSAYRQPWSSDPPLLERRKGAGVGGRVPACRDGQIVAAQLALEANLARRPPDHRVIEEQRLRDRLQQVD